jgi:hypothetical protein
MFDLEKAIIEWKKNLYKNQALEDSHIVEMEESLCDEVDALIESGMTQEEAFLRVSTEMGNSEEIGMEFAKVYSSHRFSLPSWQPTAFMPALIWNYIKIALRKIRRQTGYSVITIAGLAFGMACCILTIVWAQYEHSFDRFHRNADSIFRVICEDPSSGEPGPVWGAPPSLGPALAAEYPEVVRFTRYWNIPRREAIQSIRRPNPQPPRC